MKILAWDLTTRQGSMALLSRADPSSPPINETEQTETLPDSLLERREWPNDRRNSAPFFCALEEIVRAHGAPDIIVVGLGPGSYTGTRIAISAAIGLLATTHARLLGLPSICAMSTEDDYVVIGDAKRASFFFARIRRAQIVGDLELLSETDMTKRLAQASAPIYSADTVLDRVRLAFPRAELLCRVALQNENVVHAPLQPIYLRPPHITIPRLART